MKILFYCIYSKMHTTSFFLIFPELLLQYSASMRARAMTCVDVCPEIPPARLCIHCPPAPHLALVLLRIQGEKGEKGVSRSELHGASDTRKLYGGGHLMQATYTSCLNPDIFSFMTGNSAVVTFCIPVLHT